MLTNEMDIPEGIEVKEENGKIMVKGSKGELSRVFRNPHIKMKIGDGKVILSSDIERKKVKAVMGTWKALLENMIKGVTKGWKAEVKMVYSHFPVKLKVDQGKLLIENFLGEKNPRSVPVPEDLKADVKDNIITVTGLDRERVGQLCARIEQTTKIRGYDKRVFQDGCYITRKPYVEGKENEEGTA